MIKTAGKSQITDAENEGYTSDVDQHQRAFRTDFSERLKSVSHERKNNHDVAKQFRRLDSFARLLEGNSICAAVYYHEETQEIWLANNKIHLSSRDDNKQIKNMNDVFDMISQENLTIEIIIERLKDTIHTNFIQEKRFEVSALKNNDDIRIFIHDMLCDLFKSNIETKEWKENRIQSLEEDSEKSILSSLIGKIAKLSRDFLKIRDFLLSKNNNDTISAGIVKAIREKHYKILHVEGKDVHAEMRVLADVLKSHPGDETYIGISKLCCDHCGLAMNAFGIKSRGIHGQSAHWPIPFFIKNERERIQQYVGDDLYQKYEGMSDEDRNKTLELIAAKNGNKKKDRRMTADSSDSDLEFGVHFSDDELDEEVNKLSLSEVRWLTDIKNNYPDELERVAKLGVSLSAIIELFKDNEEKFECLGSQKIFGIIQEMAQNTEDNEQSVFEKFAELFDDDRELFDEILSDKEDVILEFDFDEFIFACHQEKEKASEYFEDDIEICDWYAAAVSRLKKDNGYDFLNSSDASQSDGECDSENISRYVSDGEEGSNMDSSYLEESDSEEGLVSGFRGFGL